MASSTLAPAHATDAPVRNGSSPKNGSSPEIAMPAGPFAENWDSLQAYRVPDWYLDGKFGIFIHWGPYCVPSFGSEWYARWMYQAETKEFKFHRENFGSQHEFGYKDFIPMFGGENFDADEWADLFVKAGAKFVMPVAEHHDGFAMYASDLNRWNAAEMGPKRDVLGELATAFDKAGLVLGASNHRAEHWWFFDGGREFPSDVQDEQFRDLYGPAQPRGEGEYGLVGDGPDQAFLEEWLRYNLEIVDKYQPQLVWFDWWIVHPNFRPYLLKFATYYYNRAAQWGKEVAINYKFDAFDEGTAVFDVERGQLDEIRPQFWQTDTSVSKVSWSFVHDNKYKTSASLIQDLVDIVSKNGALLLNVGPDPSGVIPTEEQQILLDIGDWLRVNGAAIYGTRPWKVYGQGPTEIATGMHSEGKRDAFTGEDVRYTVAGNLLYATTLGQPSGALRLRALGIREVGSISGVSMLCCDGKVEWKQTDSHLEVTLPATAPASAAYVFQIEGAL